MATSAVQEGLIGGCIRSVSKGTQIGEFGMKLPSVWAQKIIYVVGSVHVNSLETSAAVFARFKFGNEIQNLGLVLFNDNNTALIYLVKGCTKNPDSNKWAWISWKFVRETNCMIRMEPVNLATNSTDVGGRKIIVFGHFDEFREIPQVKHAIFL